MRWSPVTVRELKINPDWQRRLLHRKINPWKSTTRQSSTWWTKLWLWSWTGSIRLLSSTAPTAKQRRWSLRPAVMTICAEWILLGILGFKNWTFNLVLFLKIICLNISVYVWSFYCVVLTRSVYENVIMFYTILDFLRLTYLLPNYMWLDTKCLRIYRFIIFKTLNLLRLLDLYNDILLLTIVYKRVYYVREYVTVASKWLNV